MLRVLLLTALALAHPAAADTVVAARTLRAQTQLSAADVVLVAGDTTGAYSAVEDVIGLESLVAIYAGQPVRSGEVGPAAVIERNQAVTLHYRRGGLTIFGEGRALGRAAAGEHVRAMNLASRQTVTGVARADGVIVVGAAEYPITH